MSKHRILASRKLSIRLMMFLVAVAAVFMWACLTAGHLLDVRRECIARAAEHLLAETQAQARMDTFADKLGDEFRHMRMKIVIHHAVDRDYHRYCKLDYERAAAMPWLGAPAVPDPPSRVQSVDRSRQLSNDRPVALYLENTGVTNDMLGRLASRTTLLTLDLGENPIDDRGLKHLLGLDDLLSLELGGTGVTDEGIMLLKDMPNLIQLGLRRTRVTGAGVERLRKLMPNAHIDTVFRVIF